MRPEDVRPPYDQLMATAERVARERPEVDLEMAREVFLEAATLLDDGLVLDGLDDHDQHDAVAAVCEDLVAVDPGAALRARAAALAEHGSSELHDPASVARSLEIAVALFKL